MVKIIDEKTNKFIGNAIPVAVVKSKEKESTDNKASKKFRIDEISLITEKKNQGSHNKSSFSKDFN